MSCGIYSVTLPVRGCKMFRTIKTAGVSYVCNRLISCGEQDLCMIQSNFGQILMWRDIHYRFENATKMKRAHQAMLCQLLQRNVLTKIFKDVSSCIFDCAQVKLFQRISQSRNGI